MSVRFFKTDNILAVKVAQWKKRWFVLYNSRYTAKNLIFFSCHSVFLPCINKNQLFNSCWENYYLVVRWDLRIIHGMHFFLPPIGPLYIQFLLNTNIFSFTSMQVIHSVEYLLSTTLKWILCYCESDCALNHASSIKKFQISYQMK